MADKGIRVAVFGFDLGGIPHHIDNTDDTTRAGAMVIEWIADFDDSEGTIEATICVVGGESFKHLLSQDPDRENYSEEELA